MEKKMIEEIQKTVKVWELIHNTGLDETEIKVMFEGQKRLFEQATGKELIVKDWEVICKKRGVEYMLVKDFIKKEICIDVCNDYDASLFMAFRGPAKLTEEGYNKFGDVLDNLVSVYDDLAVIHVRGGIKTCLVNNSKDIYELFSSLAGCCSTEDYDKWFV